ncbi:RluA family pseudouridine synthase [Croceitalea rosinachiae]|uniref:RluA family pseudouridine synthase n=1 Tax=Croceitalea rosinachiae TaxID=3075596 RepID=A0ABU3A9J7_9FLAO|nr:RluA family pseudouridine synthase [Croceitalea sp. F388]MDT0606844.1 RluA family pseudouridine synthase [Croceitalea sp. F388]
MEVPTKSALKKVLKKGFITVNGVLATTATLLSGDEEIALYIPKKTQTHKKLVFPLTVLFEDRHLAAIHKPAGVLVSGNTFKTIAAALPQNLKPSSLPDATTPQPAHRLDYATTGVLLVGKTGSAIRALNQLFEDKAIQKTYYAITIGTMPPSGTITTAVDDKPAQSVYEVAESVASERFGHLNLVRLHPKTGRRHQLRKHLLSIGNPILGDATYSLENMVLKGKGLYLHAHSLAFTHPFTQEEVLIQDELPQKFTRIFSS